MVPVVIVVAMGARMVVNWECVRHRFWVCMVREWLCLHALVFLLVFILELPGWVCVDFRNCATVLIRGLSCQCHTILALISLPVPLI
jgi:hypothetical protein